jgi:putative hydrolase of the HAD superfamily
MLTVAFDLWETLITDTPDLARAQEAMRLAELRSVLGAAGVHLAEGALEDAYNALWVRCHDLYWSADRDVPTSRQIAHLIEELGLHPEDMAPAVLADLELAYSNPALAVLPKAVVGAEETLGELKGQGLRLGLISNTGRTPGAVLRKVLDGLGMGQHIEAMIFSNEHGFCKPQKSIFEALKALLSVPAEDIVFVGDNIYCDVWGAQQSGMRGILFAPEARGLAVARPIEHGQHIEPDAVISDLRQLPAVLARLSA